MVARLVAVAFVAVLVFAAGVPAQAGFLDTILVSGSTNLFIDESREAYIDLDASATVTAGDVIAGYIRINERTAPTALSFSNKVYAVFSQTITGPDPLTGIGLSFGPTGGAFSLSAITGSALPAASMAAIYTRPGGALFPTDLILASPADSVPPVGKTMADYIASVVAGSTLELAAGFAFLSPDFLVALTSGPAIAITSPLAALAGLPSSVSIASYTAGMSILLNNTSHGFLPLVPTFNPFTGGGTLHDLVISSGAVAGSGGVVNAAEWTNAAGVGGVPAPTQCPAGPCGFIDKANYSVHPIPAPTALVLLGVGLMGLAGLSRIRRIFND